MMTAANQTEQAPETTESEHDEKSTISLSIRCFTCKLPFTPRIAFGRKAWLQRTGAKKDGEAVGVHLCGECIAGFSSPEAALDFLDGVLENQIGAAPSEPPPGDAPAASR